MGRCFVEDVEDKSRREEGLGVHQNVSQSTPSMKSKNEFGREIAVLVSIARSFLGF